MNTSVYLISEADYFPILYTPHSWEKTLSQLESIPSGKNLCIDGKGLSTAGKVYTFWQKIKGFLGFEDYTDEVKVGAFLAKFIYQGALCGYLQKNEGRMLALQKKIETSELKIHQAVKGFFKFPEISISSPSTLQQKLIHYFEQNKERIKPSFWNRFCADTIPLSSKARFGDTHLILAKSEEEWQPTRSLEHYRTAAELCNLTDRTFTQDLVKSFDQFVSRGHHYPKQIAAIDLLLADRLFNHAEFTQANRLYARAAKNNGAFSEKQKVFYLHSALHLNSFQEMESISTSIDVSNEPAVIKRIFAEAMSQLGDHHFAKINSLTTRVYRVITIGNTPSPACHAQQANKFYKRGEAALKGEQELRILHQSFLNKNLNLARHLPPSDPFQPLSANPSEHLTQIYDALATLTRLNPLENLNSPQARQQIGDLSSSIMKFYLRNGPAQCLKPIEKALELIGIIKERFRVNQNFRRTQRSIQCSTPHLVNNQNNFTTDVGASLHFLKAELLRLKFGNTLEVLEEYKLAANLALQNPFGAAALFMEDPQQHPTMFLNDILVYRNLAIEWGTQELKDLIMEQEAANQLV